MTFSAKGTGCDTCYLPFFSLCFIKPCYDKEEFDTDCSENNLSSCIFLCLKYNKGDNNFLKWPTESKQNSIVQK